MLSRRRSELYVTSKSGGRRFTEKGAVGAIGATQLVIEVIGGRGSNILGRIVQSEREDRGRLFDSSRQKDDRKWGFATSNAVSLFDKKP